jgi:hypothetical protein
MLAIAAHTDSDPKRALLAYSGVYACGYSGKGSLEKFYVVNSSMFDTAFVFTIMRSVRDEVRSAEWVVVGWDHERVFLERAGVRAFCWRSRSGSREFRIGTGLTLSLPVVVYGRIPGFLARSGITERTESNISRLYLNIRPRAAIWALRELAHQLDTKQVSYEMKVLAHPRAYLRRDACVIYVGSGQTGLALEVVQRAISSLSAGLDEGVPLLTKKIALGVGFADDPSDIQGDELSHGQWVSSLFFEASKKSGTPDGIADAVIQSIRDNGRDPEHPYLRPGHRSRYLESQLANGSRT